MEKYFLNVSNVIVNSSQMNRNVNKIGTIMLCLGYINVPNVKLNVNPIRDVENGIIGGLLNELE